MNPDRCLRSFDVLNLLEKELKRIRDQGCSKSAEESVEGNIVAASHASVLEAELAVKSGLGWRGRRWGWAMRWGKAD